MIITYLWLVAPIKALCSERHEDWKNKFTVHGLKCIEITGDSEVLDYVSLITNYQLIITTPEKWDSLTKKCKEFKYQLNMIKLFLIDEVGHYRTILLNSKLNSMHFKGSFNKRWDSWCYIRNYCQSHKTNSKNCKYIYIIYYII